MKYIIMVFCFLAACKSAPDKQAAAMLLAPGMVADSAAVPITGNAQDKLNNATFSVKVLADSNIKYGVYAVRAMYGEDEARGTFTLPKGGEKYVPVIAKPITDTSCMIGFKVPGDTAFYEYFRVQAIHDTLLRRTVIIMAYVKSYSVQ